MADKDKSSKGGNEYGQNGYPNNVANTQTRKIRGTGAARKGTGYSKNSN